MAGSDAVASSVRGILQAAERAAEQIRREATADAARLRLEAGRVAAATLADARRRADELLGASGSGTAAVELGLAPPLGEARLMALEMAMAGRARGEVEDDLRHGLRVRDPHEILDDIFGRGSDRESRLQWSQVEGS